MEKGRLANEEDGWESKIHSVYCPNCGNKVAGIIGQDGRVKMSCSRCNVRLVERHKSSIHTILDIYAS